jgi:hypothetical protein
VSTKPGAGHISISVPLKHHTVCRACDSLKTLRGPACKADLINITEMREFNNQCNKKFYDPALK